MIGQPLDPVVAERYRSEGFWTDESLWDRFSHRLVEQPDSCAYVESDRTYTFGQVGEAVSELADRLRAHGLAKGNTVAVHLPNSVTYVVAVLAVNRIGGIVVPQAPDIPRDDARFIYEFTPVDAVVCVAASDVSQVAFDWFEEADGKSAGPPTEFAVANLAVALVTPGEPRQTVQDFRDGERGAALCRFMFTSGSTGVPKCVVHDNNTTVAGLDIQDRINQVSSSSKLLVCIPVWLNWGMFQVLSPIVTGSQVVILQKFSPTEVIELIRTHEVTHLGVPPTGIQALLDYNRDWSTLKSLQIVATAGAPCPTHLIEEFSENANASIIEGYGMTEAGWIAVSSPDPAQYVLGSVGPPVTGTEIRLEAPAAHGSDGEEIQHADDVGEVVVRNPELFRGYLKSPAANDAVWSEDRWFRTGDLGRFGDGGQLFIEGRIKDTIKHGGHLVAPDEIEDKLIKHPSVADVAIVGTPDAYFGENICACVVLAPDVEAFTLEDATEFLSTKLPKHKLPQQISVLESLPRTPTGKLRKAELKASLGYEQPAP